MPRHVGIMKTSESDGTKRLILAIFTNTLLFGFFLSERRYTCIDYLSILKNELNKVEFL